MAAAWQRESCDPPGQENTPPCEPGPHTGLPSGVTRHLSLAARRGRRETGREERERPEAALVRASPLHSEGAGLAAGRLGGQEERGQGPRADGDRKGALRQLGISLWVTY